ncbi:PREDICTED: uncharacterized protein LOC108361660 isoform X2 [Rhagoletis zephyria]|nr:PREDICTED: uncharacterized protein LOC108361660 isoform X2 [Rhagoletis zephyria]
MDNSSATIANTKKRVRKLQHNWTSQTEQLIVAVQVNNENHWDGWSPQSLKTPITPVLKKPKKTENVKKSKFDHLTEARIELVELQKDMALKEMEYKKKEMEQKTSEHEFRMAHYINEEKSKEELHHLNLSKNF